MTFRGGEQQQYLAEFKQLEYLPIFVGSLLLATGTRLLEGETSKDLILSNLGGGNVDFSNGAISTHFPPFERLSAYYNVKFDVISKNYDPPVALFHLSMPQNILIIGATGLIGTPITKAIINAKSSFGRIAILTSSATLTSKASVIDSFQSNGVEIFTGDLSNEQDVKNAYHDIDTVISCVGRNAILTQISLIQWASETSVSRFFPSEYGTDIEYSPASEHEKPHQLKLKVRAYAKTVKNLEFTYLVTGPYSDLYFGKSGKDEIGTFDVKAKKAVLLGDGKGRVSFTTMADVGKLVVGALQHPDASRNAILIVNSFTTTPAEILTEFEKQTSNKWEVSYTPLEKLKEIEKQAWVEGLPYATPCTLRRIWTEGGTLYGKRDNGLIGDPEMQSVADQVKQVIAQQMQG